MPLKSPVLDDKTYKDDIVAEVKKLIPRYAPEWTDWNEHDPGISLIQLFAWMSEMILYRLNQVPEKNFIEFLKLIGTELLPAAPAKADLTFTLSDGVESAVIPKGTQVGLEDDSGEDPIIFETDERLTATGITLDEIQSYDGSAYTIHTQANGVSGQEYYAFGKQALKGSALYLGFSYNGAFPQKEIKLSIYLYTEDLISAGRHCQGEENSFYPSAQVNWEYWNGTSWSELEVAKDETFSLMRSGSVLFNGPAGIGKSKAGNSQQTDYYWIRCAVEIAGYEIPPRIDTILLNTATASNAVTVKGEILGSSDGTPDQTFTLQHTPVSAGTLVLQVNEGDGWDTWTEVDDFNASTREDAHFTLNRETGLVSFGDGVEHGRIPLPASGGNNIMALTYRYGGGKRGNVGKGKLVSLLSSVPYVDEVTNAAAASGGLDEETVDAAKKRGPAELKTRDRAVTMEDFELLARGTPGARVRRAKALPLFHPRFPRRQVPGAISVIIVPESKEDRPMPSEGLMKTVCSHLNRHRLLTSEVYVIPPQYVKIKVEATVFVEPEADAGAVKSDLARNLKRFLHPLNGGADGEGWPFGGDIYFSDVYKIILKTDGVARVETVSLYMDGKKQEASKNVEIPGYALIYSDEHVLHVAYDKG